MVTGTGSLWINGASLTIGERGEGLLTVADGGRVSANDVKLGDDDTGHGIVLISGVDSAGNASTIEAHGSVSVGDWSSGKMTIKGGGQVIAARDGYVAANLRSEEHTSELQSLMPTSYAVFCLKKKNKNKEK